MSYKHWGPRQPCVPGAERVCRDCGLVGVVGEEFYVTYRKSGPKAGHIVVPTRCRKCHVRSVSETRDERNHKDGNLRRNYGISIDQFDMLMGFQGGVCAICKTDTPGGKGTYAVDHDHKTGEVRGLLCKNCNLCLGHLKDDVLTLKAAIEYLQSPPARMALAV